MFRMWTTYLLIMTLTGIISVSPQTSFNFKENNVGGDQTNIGEIGQIGHFGQKGDKIGQIGQIGDRKTHVGDYIGTKIGDGASNICSGSGASCNFGRSSISLRLLPCPYYAGHPKQSMCNFRPFTRTPQPN